MTILILVRLWLITGVPKILLSMWHDDLYYAQAAHALIHGEWLGSYTQMTVIKAPFYAFFLLFSSFTGLPLLFNETAFFALACLVLFFALKPWIKNPWWRLLIFAVMLFCPPGLNNEWTLRVYREFVYLSLTLFVVSFALGLLLRLEGKISTLFWWVLGLGVSMGAFMITREEGVWIYPVLFLFFVFCILHIFKKKPDKKWWRSALILISIVIWYLPTLAVSFVNYSNYGFWGISETLDSDFNLVLNTLQRIKTQDWHPYQTVSEETWNKAGEASPLFAELIPYFEQNKVDWQHITNDALRMRPDWYLNLYFTDANTDIGNSHFSWLLRDAMQATGKYEDGYYPRSYLQEVAGQLQEACDNKVLDCKTAINIPLVNSITLEQIPLTFRFFADDFYRLLTLDGIGVKNIPIDLSKWTYYRDEFKYYEEFVNNPVDSHLMGEEQAEKRMIGDHRDMRFSWIYIKGKLMKNIQSAYKLVLLPASLLAALIWVGLLIRRMATKQSNLQPLHLSAIGFLFGLLVVRLFLLAILDATTDIPAFYYSNSCYLFLFVFLVLTFWAFFNSFSFRNNAPK